MIDWILSALHFLLTFVLVGMLAAQSVLIRPKMSVSELLLAANWD